MSKQHHSNQEFNDSYHKLKDESDSSILCIEDICKLIELSLFETYEILLLTIQKDSGKRKVIPSLSIYKPKSKQSEVIKSTADIYEKLLCSCQPLDDPKELQKIIKIGKQRDFVIEESKWGVILYRPLDKNISSSISKLLKLSKLLRERSLNAFNSSKDRAIRDWEKLSRKIDSSIENAAKCFSEFVQEEYNLKSSLYFFDAKDQKWFLEGFKTKKQDDKIEIIDKYRSYLDQKKPFYGYHKKYYFLLLPFVSRRADNYMQFIIILYDHSHINSHITMNLLDFTDYYFSEFLEREKMRFLSDLRYKVIHARQVNAKGKILKTLDFENKVKEFASKALNSALRMTNAFSGTCRLYDATLDGLRLIADCSNRGVHRTSYKGEDELIHLRSKSISINAKTFKSGQETYIPILDSGKHYVNRHSSMSEICFPLKYKYTCIGTVNFEAPMCNGFVRDRVFLRDIATCIGEYLTSILDINDKYWLSQRAMEEENLHEAANTIADSSLSQQEKTKLFQAIGYQSLSYDDRIKISDVCDSERKISNYKEAIRLSYFEIFRRKYRDENYLDIPGTENIFANIKRSFDSGCKTYFKRDLDIDAYRYSLILLIYRNLLSNYMKYCDKRVDHLLMTHDGNLNSPLKLYLQSSTVPPEIVLKCASIIPIPSSDPYLKGEKKGLLLVGILARQLGGFVHVAGDENQSKFEIFIDIPIE